MTAAHWVLCRVLLTCLWLLLLIELRVVVLLVHHLDRTLISFVIVNDLLLRRLLFGDVFRLINNLFVFVLVAVLLLRIKVELRWFSLVLGYWLRRVGWLGRVFARLTLWLAVRKVVDERL